VHEIQTADEIIIKPDAENTVIKTDEKNNSGRRLYLYNQNDLRYKFWFEGLNNMDTQNNGNKEKTSFSLITCKLVIRKKLVNKKL